MGAKGSTLAAAEIEELQRLSGFTPQQIKMLYKRFKRLDKDNSGTITADDFLSIPELAINPLISRVIAVFDDEDGDNVNFRQFIEVLSVFRNTEDNRDKKIEFAFRIYDIDHDGFITDKELFEVLKMMVGDNLSDEQLQQIAAQTIREADTDGDGKISREEFYQVVGPADIVKKLSVNF
eukprot:comp29152_c0_seq1/m.47221 comp29152_c0_seq1/g.47221  ORF comp29152_c0_seq1/g.47221 comp29152_c0_seq1/m.47221 type:complete len:179 (-) comp29152_c0_seq1:588-1124(-)